MNQAAGALQKTAQTAKQIHQAVSKSNAAAKNAAHASQAAHAATAAVKGGTTAAGAATGTALAGPLGTIIGTLVTSRTFWKIIGGILLFLFLWMFIIANMIGILLSYLGFANADAFANEAQSEQLASLRNRVEKILENEEYKNEILSIIENEHAIQLQEITNDHALNYADYELEIVDECETKLKRNLSYYLAVLLTETWDGNSIQSFLGYDNVLGLDMTTDLTYPNAFDSYFEEASLTHGVPKALIVAMAKAESDFNPSVVSSAGAIGVMQLMPGTAASLGVSDPYDARQNIMGGAKYIAQNIEQFKEFPNCLELAIAAYNAGPGAVIRYGYQVPPYSETQNYVKKVLGYVKIQENSSGNTSQEENEESEEDLSTSYNQLKKTVEEQAGSFFSWTVTDEKENEVMKTIYYVVSGENWTEIDKVTYDRLLQENGNVIAEEKAEKVKGVEYTLALLLNTYPSGGSQGYEYKYVTNKSTFELVVKVLKLLSDGVDALRENFFSLFSWRDFVSGEDSYVGNIDATGDIITYDTVGNGQKRVVYFNQGEEPWGSMPYGTSTIGAAGCGPTSVAIIISTLTGQNVTPQMTCAYSIANGEYVPGAGTAHSFPTNAAKHWGLTCERVGKDRMDYVVQALKEGKMVIEICEAYTITGSGSGHFIVLTGVTRDGYITIADCASRERTGKVYSVETIKSYGRDLSEGAFWIIGKK